MQIEVTTRLTTCCYYRFEGGEFSDPLKSFMLLLSACLAGLDEFSGGGGKGDEHPRHPSMQRIQD